VLCCGVLCGDRLGAALTDLLDMSVKKNLLWTQDTKTDSVNHQCQLGIGNGVEPDASTWAQRVRTSNRTLWRLFLSVHFLAN
jgi:hypothetical protein